MNVLQVLPELGAGGVERSTVEIAEALLREGHGAEVASNGGALVDTIRAMGGICHTLPLRSKNPIIWRMSAPALTAIIRQRHIDIVHVRSRAPAFPARWAVARAKRFGANVKLVTTYHGIYNAKSSLKRRYNAVMTQADAVIANSEFTRDHIIAEHGLSPDRIDVIPRGITLTRFPLDIAQARIQKVRANWDVADQARVLFLPGRLTRWKGQLEAIQAMDGIDDLTLVIQGDAQGRDQYVAALRQAASRLPSGRVKIVGAQDDMAACYAASHGVIVPSQDPEAFGRVTAEGCAMGKPVIATAHGGAVEILDGGQLGLMATPGRVSSIHEQIALLAAMRPDQARNFAAPAQERIRTLYTTEAMCAATLGVYARLLQTE